MKQSAIKQTSFGMLAFVLVLLGVATAQDKAKPGVDPDHMQASVPSHKMLTISGKVSDDGKTFITDIDSEWALSNAEALKGREGARVTVKCYIDADRDTLHVLSVKSEQVELKYAAKRGDSAFRR